MSGGIGARNGRAAVVVLAAGASARMGRPKQLLRLQGVPLLEHVIRSATASSAAEVIVVLGHQAKAIGDAIASCPPGSLIVVNEHHARGQATSLQAGLRACPDSVACAVVVLGDEPEVSAPAIDAALEHWRRGMRPVVRTVYRGVPGHPVVLGREIWHLLPAAGDRGARSLIEGRPDLVADVVVEAAPPIDVDTEEDLTLLEQRFGRAPSTGPGPGSR